MWRGGRQSRSQIILPKVGVSWENPSGGSDFGGLWKASSDYNACSAPAREMCEICRASLGESVSVILRQFWCHLTSVTSRDYKWDESSFPTQKHGKCLVSLNSNIFCDSTKYNRTEQTVAKRILPKVKENNQVHLWNAVESWKGWLWFFNSTSVTGAKLKWWQTLDNKSNSTNEAKALNQNIQILGRHQTIHPPVDISDLGTLCVFRQYALMRNNWFFGHRHVNVLNILHFIW